MRDDFGREINYMRISVTDRCNMRCIYCMPEEGVPSVDHSKILRYQDILRICEAAVQLGIHKIKLTGGEPLVRRGIVSLVRDLKTIDGIDEVTLTTNGVLLEEMYEELADAGLDAVTISLDTLDAERFACLTRRDYLPIVLRGLQTAVDRKRIPVKINCVPMAETSEQELLDVASLARDMEVHVRFIELMPIGQGKSERGWTQERLSELLAQAFGKPESYFGNLGNGPAKYVQYPGFSGKIGWISAVSHAFCSECNRVRLTSEGFLKCCLQYERGVDLRPALNAGDTDLLLQEMARGIRMKPEHHSFNVPQDVPDKEMKNMSQIGG